MKRRFKIGDIVKIKDSGGIYQNYNTWADKHGLTRWRKNYDFGIKGHGKVKGKFKVIRIEYHSSVRKKFEIYAIENVITGVQHIIDFHGLKLIESIQYKLPEELFEI
jgi:hypothetical protein